MPHEADMHAIQELFASIAANHAKPVKNFIFEVRRGAATREWIEICRPVMATLIEGADSMGLPDVTATAREFDRTLELAANENPETLDEAARERILEAYEAMCKVLPPEFSVDDNVRRREGIIVHSLLKQIRGMGHVTFTRLYGASLTSLDMLSRASPEELSVTTGVPIKLSKRICAKITEHMQESEATPRAGRRNHLSELLAELREQHRRFDEASENLWSDEKFETEKREARLARLQCALKIEVILAEIGEADLVEQLRKLPFVRRIQEINDFLTRDGEFDFHEADQEPSELQAKG
jgi:chemotaxis protein histidine kinase CheA